MAPGVAVAVPHTRLADATCPVCSHQGLDYNAEQIDLPYLGESMETMMRCPACGYRHTDFILVESKDPTRSTLTVSTEADMSVRVVRASSGTIRIPEHGISIEPGTASEAFISNVEGIIVRVEAILMQLRRDAEAHGDAAKRDAIDALMDTFEAARNGAAEPMTLIIEDPLGNSAIVSKAASVVTLSPEEAGHLSMGMPVFDQDAALGQAMQEEEEE